MLVVIVDCQKGARLSLLNLVRALVNGFDALLLPTFGSSPHGPRISSHSSYEKEEKSTSIV